MIRRFAGLSLLSLVACEIEIAPDGHRSPTEIDQGLDRERPYEEAPIEPERPEGDPCSDEIVPQKELVITHESVVSDPRSAWAFGSFVTEEDAYVLGRPRTLRLLAIVNRPDLRQETDGCAGAGGELRFVYAASSTSTVIVEIPWPASRTPREWTTAWHALGEEKLGTRYNDALEQLTRDIVAGSPRASWKIRTNDRAYGATWELRNYEVADGTFRQRPLDGTCQSCHGAEAPAFQHIASTGSGTRLSDWLEEEELPRRAQSMRAALCAPACGGGDYR